MLNLLLKELQLFESSSLGVKALTVIGAIQLLSLSVGLAGFIWKYVRPAKNLSKRYGSNAWAVVTGPTEGIGKAFCFSLAARGFNVVLVARNQSKAEGVVANLQARFPQRQFRVVIADFSKSLDKEANLANHIFSQIAELDIAILVNNVGLSFTPTSEYFHEFPIHQIIELITVNTAPQSQLTHALLPKLIERCKKSKAAIINLSSLAGTVPLPFLEIYSATKAFNDHLSNCLALEYDQMDILSLRPMVVKSNLTNEIQETGMAGGIISAEQCSESTLNQLGSNTTTFGHFKHGLQASILNLLPMNIRIRFMGFSNRILLQEINKIIQKRK